MLNEKVNELTNSGQDVKLHLGCGPFLFDGYINVDGDYIQNSNVINYDISVTPYPLPDNSVDEILFLSLTKSSLMFGKYIGVIATGFVLRLNILSVNTW